MEKTECPKERLWMTAWSERVESNLCYGSLKIKLLWRVPTFAVFWVNIFADRIAVFLLQEELLFGRTFISADSLRLRCNQENMGLRFVV